MARITGGLSSHGHGRDRPGSEYIIRTCALAKGFKGFVAVNDVNLKISRSTNDAMIGLNDAGKMVEHNFGVEPPIAATISVLNQGEDLAEGPHEEVLRNEVVAPCYIGAAHA